MKTVKKTEFKTKRINQLTGGQIKDFKIPDRPNNEGLLPDSFLSMKGEYIGTYGDAWWFINNNMVVCDDYPHGVAIRLNSFKPKIKLRNAIKDKFESWFCEQWENDNLLGYYGYTHRGGQTFKIGDRLFDENYEPKEEDYSNGEWTKFMIKRVECVKRDIKKGYAKTEEEAFNNIPISDVIPFCKRGRKLIDNWSEAKQAAINMSNYLS